MTTSYAELPNINKEAGVYCQMFGKQPYIYYLTQNDGLEFVFF